MSKPVSAGSGRTVIATTLGAKPNTGGSTKKVMPAKDKVDITDSQDYSYHPTVKTVVAKGIKGTGKKKSA